MINTSQWICEGCSRSRRTNFCPDCGTVRPPATDNSAKSLNKLNLLLKHCRKNEQSQHNSAETAISRGGQGSNYRRGEEKWRDFGNAISWAILEIEKP